MSAHRSATGRSSAHPARYRSLGPLPATARAIASAAQDRSISDAHATRDEIEKQISAARATRETARKNSDRLKNKMRSAEEKYREHQQLLAGTEKKLVEIERALTEKESRLEILRQLDQEGEGLAQGSQAVLKGLDNPLRIQPAIAGALASNLDVDPGYIAAIEAALGQNVQAIVLQDVDLAPEIMATLTEKKLGPAALAIPKFFSSSPRTDAALPQTALAWAIEKVKTPDSLASLVTRLLHNVAIFRSLDEDLAFKKNGTDLAAATRAGEFVSSEGVVFGGSRDASADSVLERKARISALSAEYSHICQERDALLGERDDASTQLEKTRRDFEEIRAHHEIADREQSASENKILFLERELHEIEQKIEHLRSEQSTLAQQIEVADERITKLEQELTAERVQLESQQAQQRAVEAAREKAAASEEEASHQSNELRLALATEQQRYQNLVAQRQPMTDRETELSDMIASRQTEIANFENRLESQTDESRDAEAAIQEQTGCHVCRPADGMLIDNE